ncbi:MAG: SDR family oxidoreductase [Hyphomicrobiaceae bacterium]|nr:SDR family oxidoreductase [Hyphomicrobiaceae bacterium]
MDLGIAGRTAIVCGSSRGLGRATAEALARAGVTVVVNGIDAGRVEQVAGEIARATNGRTLAVAADVTTREGQDKLFAAVAEPDILVTNAGGPPFKDFRELDRAAIVAGVTANMVTPIELIQRAVDGMVERKFGRIVNITSVSVKMPVVGLDLSSGARAGLTAFLAGVSRSVAHANVTINNLLPGFIQTDRYRGGIEATARIQGVPAPEVEAARIATIPARRIGSPAEFGATCAFLCSAPAGYITGQNILVDGGIFNAAF